MIRALVADGAASTREQLVALLRTDPQIQVVGQARNGVETVAMIKRLRPAVAAIGVRLPGMDGVETTKRVMSEAPIPIVLVASHHDAQEVQASVLALRAGALAVVPMPLGSTPQAFDGASRHLLSTLKAMSEVKVVRHWAERSRLQTPPCKPGLTERARIVAIAASTGGPAALQRVLSELPATFPAPILLVQHIAHGFVEGLVGWLNTVCSLKVKVAADREVLAPHSVYLAPDHSHLGVGDRSRILLSRTAPIGGFRPSASFLFESVANAFGPGAVAVVLTGMGQDGVDGLRAIRSQQGRVLAQDEASSVVFGMPGAALAARVVDHVLPLSAIASSLIAMVHNRNGPESIGGAIGSNPDR